MCTYGMHVRTYLVPTSAEASAIARPARPARTGSPDIVLQRPDPSNMLIAVVVVILVVFVVVCPSEATVMVL